MFDIASVYMAKSVADAVEARVKDPGAVIICGGSDVLIKIREGKLSGCRLISINGIPELSNITLLPDGAISIGSAASFTQITNDPIISEHIPALGYAVDQAGGPQLRNVATIGGNICNGVTSADSAATLLTLNARLIITGPEGEREVLLENFYTGPGKVALKSGELLTAVRIPKADYEGFGGHYIKYAMRNAMDIATLGVAVHVRLDAAKKAIDGLRLAFGVAAPTPIRCRAAEEALRGAALDEAAFSELGLLALKEVRPRTSWRASKEFREQLVRELSGRALKQAALNAGGQII
jgi:xanthine dehydrogenase FAD-binding subunit